MIAVTFVLGSYYAAHPESKVLSFTTDSVVSASKRPTATPTPTAGGQVMVNFVKYDTAKKGWVYATAKSDLILTNAKNKVVELAHANSQGWGFKREPLGVYYVRFNPSIASQAAICTSSCFSIPTSGYSTTNPVKVTLSTNNQHLNVYLKLK